MMISVIIPNYNNVHYLYDCVNSLLIQTYKNFEVIIVDNGSTDESIEVLKTLKSNCRNLRVIELDKNYGFAFAVNRGIEISKGEYVVLINNDTLLDRDFLFHLVTFLKEKENVFSCSSKMIQFYDRKKIDDAGDYYTIFGWQYKRGNNFPVRRYSKPYEIISSCGGGAIYDKKILLEIGCFDEDFFAYLEDVDLGLRAVIRGYKNLYCPAAKILHVGSASTGSKYNDFKVKLTARNSIYLLYKNMPLPLFIINSPFIILGYIIKFIFFSCKGLGQVYIEGIKEGLMTLRKFKQKRRENMQKRRISLLKFEWYIFKSTVIFVYESIFRFISK